ncbi:hypothetical protein D3C71_2189080 [compost metagenome]
MLHGINYPDETPDGQRLTRLWRPKMEKGMIRFIRPDECTITRPAGEGTVKAFHSGNMQGVDELYAEYFP